MIEIRYICLNVHVYVRIYFILDFSEHENRDNRIHCMSKLQKNVFPFSNYSKSSITYTRFRHGCTKVNEKEFIDSEKLFEILSSR